MRITLSLLLCITIFTALAQSDELLLEKALYNLPDVSFKKISLPGDKYLKYDLMIRQPVDHQHPEGDFFYQHVILTHKGFKNSTIMETQGYWLYPGLSELADYFNANDLNIEYRYCGKSKPDSLIWDYLTLEQATADLHAINQLFRNIYKGKWISTGISKGGETTIYYKFFFPKDVDLSIPYVAPLDNSMEDLRIYHFFDTISTAACRERIFNLQVFLLKHEKEALEKLYWYSIGDKSHYDYVGGIGRAFEYSVLEYPFSFWQYTGICDSVPTNESLDNYIRSLLKIVSISAFSDETNKLFEAHYYQASTQSGYYGYNITKFKKYLNYFTENPSASFPPKIPNMKPFDGSLNEKVSNWLVENGNNMLYIYGGVDTWTSAGVIVSDKVNSKRFVVPYATHATARIKNMSSQMQQEFAQKAKEMTGLEMILPNH